LFIAGIRFRHDGVRRADQRPTDAADRETAVTAAF